MAIPPDAEAKKVFTTTEPISSQFPTAPSVEPGLNPNHPNHNTNTPIDAKGKLCPGIVLEVPSFEYFPILGPKTLLRLEQRNHPLHEQLLNQQNH